MGNKGSKRSGSRSRQTVCSEPCLLSSSAPTTGCTAVIARGDEVGQHDAGDASLGLLQALPQDMLHVVLLYSSAVDVAAAGSTCRLLQKLVRSNTLWHHFVWADFGFDIGTATGADGLDGMAIYAYLHQKLSYIRLVQGADPLAPADWRVVENDRDKHGDNDRDRQQETRQGAAGALRVGDSVWRAEGEKPLTCSLTSAPNAARLYIMNHLMTKIMQVRPSTCLSTLEP